MDSKLSTNDGYDQKAPFGEQTDTFFQHLQSC